MITAEVVISYLSQQSPLYFLRVRHTQFTDFHFQRFHSVNLY